MVNKRMSDEKARKLALGEGGGMPYLRTHRRADASRTIINLEQNDQVIALLTQIAEDMRASRLALDHIARNTPAASRP